MFLIFFPSRIPLITEIFDSFLSWVEMLFSSLTLSFHRCMTVLLLHFPFHFYLLDISTKNGSQCGGVSSRRLALVMFFMVLLMFDVSSVPAVSGSGCPHFFCVTGSPVSVSPVHFRAIHYCSYLCEWYWPSHCIRFVRPCIYCIALSPFFPLLIHDAVFLFHFLIAENISHSYFQFVCMH